MKNAYVIEHHLGDNGTVTEGMILSGITDKRFAELEKKGLVREATAEEVDKGFVPPFDASGVTLAGDAGDEDGNSGGAGGETGEKAAQQPQNKAKPAPLNKAASTPAAKA